MPVKRSPKTPPLPTPVSRRLVRYVVGFGIGVGLGMAPFLGRVPGMGSLLELFPEEMRRTLIPSSIFLMGLITVAVQFYSAESISRAALRRRFSIALIALLSGFFLFLGLYAGFVETSGKVPVVLGTSRLPGCGCNAARLSDSECVANLSYDPRAIDSCWGNRRLVRLFLGISYLLLTGGFAALIGLLLLQEDRRRAKRKRRPSATETAPT